MRERGGSLADPCAISWRTCRKPGFHLLQAILGLDADAHGKTLYVHPLLPPWLPNITLHNLRFGNSKARLRFWKEKDETRYERSLLKGSARQARASAGCINANTEILERL
jgi:hypothetical protein